MQINHISYFFFRPAHKPSDWAGGYLVFVPLMGINYGKLVGLSFLHSTTANQSVVMPLLPIFMA